MNPTDEVSTATTTPTDAVESPADALRAQLEKAAELAVSQGMDASAFSEAAVNAYMAKNPSFRDELEARHLFAQLAYLRAQGRIALA